MPCPFLHLMAIKIALPVAHMEIRVCRRSLTSSTIRLWSYYYRLASKNGYQQVYNSFKDAKWMRSEIFMDLQVRHRKYVRNGSDMYQSLWSSSWGKERALILDKYTAKMLTLCNCRHVTYSMDSLQNV